MRTVVCVDDAEEDLQALEYQFDGHYHVVSCRDGSSALAVVSRARPDAVVLDLELPGYDGFKVLSDIRKLDTAPPVLMLSGHAEPLFVVRALKEGAADYIAKPYNISLLRKRIDLLVDAADSRNGAPKALKAWEADGRPRNGSPGREAGPLLGSSELMRRLRCDLLCYAASELPVLIQGESGTGKDLAARAIHDGSPRAGGPYQAINIAAIPQGLAESELFGCERGAFTDAKARKGCFELADGGTLFLDEIGDASYSVQTALLRISEDHLVRRLGGTTYRHVSCRLVCATNRDLDGLLACGQFRSDLKFRIDALTLRIPPLREHAEDIPELAAYFLNKLTGKDASEFGPSKDALLLLMEHPWPGNVRQLRTCLERALILSRGETIREEHIRF